MTNNGQIFLFAALTASLPLVSAQRTIGACKEQGCQDCPIYAPVELGYPSCVIYPSAGNLDGYEAESGHGYDVCKSVMGIENMLLT